MEGNLPVLATLVEQVDEETDEETDEYILQGSPHVAVCAVYCASVQCGGDVLSGGSRAARGDDRIDRIRETMPTIAKPLRLFRPLFEVASEFVEAKTALEPQTGNIDAFFQEVVNMDFSFEAALLSRFSQSRQPDVAEARLPI